MIAVIKTLFCKKCNKDTKHQYVGMGHEFWLYRCNHCHTPSGVPKVQA